MILEKISAINELTQEEKLILVGELWDNLVQSGAEIPVSEEVLDELDRRIDEHERDPEGTTTTWEAAKERLLAVRK